MGYTTFKTFLQWCAEATGKNAQTNRPSLVKLANLVRQHIHLLYSEVNMTVDKECCFRVQCFPVDCASCRDTYFGITIPGDMDGVETIWRNDKPIPMFGKWRESVIGIGKNESCKLQTLDQGNIFPTELDVNWQEPCVLSVRCEDAADVNKEIRISYLNQDGDKITEVIKLKREWTKTQDAVMQIVRPAGIILPEPRSGRIILAQGPANSTISEYSPYEPAIPSYKRIRFTGVCSTDTVLVKANAKYVPLFFDEDVAEFDNELAIREFAKMIVYGDNNDPGKGFQAMAQIAEAKGKKYLLGQESKTKGGAIVQQVFLGGRDINRSRLSKRRRRR